MAGGGGERHEAEPICLGRARGGRDIIQQSKIYGSVVSANGS